MTGQKQVKIIQNLSLGFTVPLLFLYCARHGVFAGHTGDCARRRRFHASAIASERRSSPRGRPRSFPFRPNPPFSSSVHDEPSSSEQHRAKPPPLVAPANPRRRSSIRCAPTHCTSPRSSSSLPRTRPCPTPAEIELRPPSAIAVFVKLRPELRPSRQRPPSGHPPPQIDPR